MSTATEDRILLFQSEQFSAVKKQSLSRFDRGDKSILAVKDVPVFRSGSFRDSMGFPHEFDDYAMESMVRNYDHLKAQGIFSDVPVRNGHPSPFRSRMQELVGYVTAMRTEKRTAPHDGSEYTYLIADFEIIDDDAQKNIESGLWRNRSSEIGTYVDNRENEYGPAFMGVAYVDIPAVEGLNGFSKADDRSDEKVHFIMEDQKMGDIITPPKPGEKTPFSFSLGGQDGITDGKAVQEYINKIESERDDFQSNLKKVTTERDRLQEFRDNIVNSEREDFVTSLVDSGKVLAPQKEQLVELAKGLSPEQFETWKGSYENVATQEVLENHGNSGQQKPNQNADDQARKDYEDDVNTVKILFGKMDAEKVKSTEAYKRVLEYDPKFVL
ncbi:hypothetical protein GMA3_5 [Gordonia phage GMA3]|uniref:Capsid maturation protease n=1 Tax=Gordonia phage GMA3 TaxID=1647284 RepID=A0A0K0NKW2_9CAUD|nr:head maturation protease [Gordonia phage GMA3]AKL88182.1 hypothetical protein GMA3_5 [Gordonia phage GMA3]